MMAIIPKDYLIEISYHNKREAHRASAGYTQDSNFSKMEISI